MGQAGQRQKQRQFTKTALSKRGRDAEFLSKSSKHVEETKDWTGRGINVSGEMIEVSAQGATKSLDAHRIPVGDVGQSARLDLAMIAVRLTDQDCGGRGAIGNRGDVHAHIINILSMLVKHHYCNYMPT